MQTVIKATRNNVRQYDQSYQRRAVTAVLEYYDISQVNGDGSIQTVMSSDNPGLLEFTLPNNRFADCPARSAAIQALLQRMGWTVLVSH